MPLSVLNAITVGGGCTFSGMNLLLTSQTIRKYGVTLNLKNDKYRQTVLSLILFFGSLCTLISYPLNQIENYQMFANGISITVFTCIQFGLVIINHNTLARLGATRTDSTFIKKLHKFYPIMYLIPFITMIPIYLAAIETFPEGLPLNRSLYNTRYFKPLNIALVLITEFCAVCTDIKLLVQVGDSIVESTQHRRKLQDSNDSTSNWKKVANYNSKDTWMDYMIIWGLLAFDISIKTLIYLGYPLLFDSSITICTLAMRARCNLQYGLMLKNMFDNPDSVVSKSVKKTEIV
ncbi:hypothetical protein BC833DRAFT_612724 [Globomyces pollinis-pini]|nr:hypothetical protein BC833DRAFT_612724 [Globomyces pollinis-pini]